MNNTIMTAKNTFANGLVMDFAPDNTQATCLTNALNATFLTFNGNEMSLQNDMGNARVETALLPQGYIPMGSCEYGGIIYIVSYNPLENKSQIGCFPSPERNISTQELGLPSISISSDDFLYMKNGEPTGKLKTTTVKKVLLLNNINPGDKFQILANTNNINNNASNITNINGQNHKIINIRVVSIDESGKLTYVDSDLVYYKLSDDNQYFIKECENINSISDADLDEYRVATSDWQIFQSKSAGKLALLIELERITGFDCNWIAYKVLPDNNANPNSTYYNLYWCVRWQSDYPKIAPKYMILTKSNIDTDVKNISMPETFDNNNCWYNIFDAMSLSNRNIDYNTIKYSYYKGLPHLNNHYKAATTTMFKTELGDATMMMDSDIINNSNKYTIKKFATIEVPNDCTKFIWEYEITPAMKYGLLDNLASSGTIDFKKLDTGVIDLNKWKYFNNDDTCNIKFELQANPKPNFTISDVTLEFYDNKGLAMLYKMQDQMSYSGERNISLNLNTQSTDKNLVFIKDINNENKLNMYYWHPGIETDENPTKDNNVYVYNDGATSKKYINDFNTLYANNLYLVKISVTQSQENINNDIYEIDSEQESTELNISNGETTVFYRWLWTNQVFNKKYSEIDDFNNLNLELQFDGALTFETTDDFKFNNIVSNNLQNEDSKLSKSKITQLVKNDVPNLNVHITLGLMDSYNTFNLEYDLNDGLTNNFKGTLAKNIPVELHGGDYLIENTSDKIPRFSENETNDDVSWIMPEEEIIYTDNFTYDDYENKDVFNIRKWRDNIIDPPPSNGHLAELENIYIDNNPITYYDANNTKRTTTIYWANRYGKAQVNENGLLVSHPVLLTLSALQVTKTMHVGDTYNNKQISIYEPLINSQSDLDLYNIGINKTEGYAYFKQGLAICLVNHALSIMVSLLRSDNDGKLEIADVYKTLKSDEQTSSISITSNPKWLNALHQEYSGNLGQFFPVYYLGTGLDTSNEAAYNLTAHNSNSPTANNKLKIKINKFTSGRSYYYFGIQNEILTYISLNNSLHGRNSENDSSESTTSTICFLGVPYNNSITLLSSGQYDMIDANKLRQCYKLYYNAYNQLDYMSLRNMAIPLLYMLAHMYNKNKVTLEKVKIKNYVSLNQYTVKYTHNLFLKVGVDSVLQKLPIARTGTNTQTNTYYNVTMNGANIEDYANVVLDKSGINIGQVTINNLQATITPLVKMFPLLFEIKSNNLLNIDEYEAGLIKPNGLTIYCPKLNDDRFYYIDNNDELVPASGDIQYELSSAKYSAIINKILGNNQYVDLSTLRRGALKIQNDDTLYDIVLERWIDAFRGILPFDNLQSLKQYCLQIAEQGGTIYDYLFVSSTNTLSESYLTNDIFTILQDSDGKWHLIITPNTNNNNFTLLPNTFISKMDFNRYFKYNGVLLFDTDKGTNTWSLENNTNAGHINNSALSTFTNLIKGISPADCFNLFD